MKISDDCFNSAAFKAGENAFIDGREPSDNPYDVSDENFNRWKMGYEFAAAKNKSS